MYLAYIIEIAAFKTVIKEDFSSEKYLNIVMQYAVQQECHSLCAYAENKVRLERIMFIL